MARVEIGGRREGQEVWARWIDGRVQGDREFLKIAGLDPGTRFEDPHAFVELIEKLLRQGIGIGRARRPPEASVTASDVSPIAFTAHKQHPGPAALSISRAYEAFTASCSSGSRSQISGSERPARTEREKK